MAEPPITDDIAAGLAQFVFRGNGPSHSALTRAFTAGGYGDVAPNIIPEGGQGPNKQTRLLDTMREVRRRKTRGREVVEALLVELRTAGCFREDRASQFGEAIATSRRAFARAGWELSEDGYIYPRGEIDLSTGNRSALDEQVDRLRRAGENEDPALLLGAAKDLLEAVAKFVLEEFSMPVSKKASFDELWHLARDRLDLLPNQVDPSVPGAANIRAILQSSWTIAKQVNELRGIEGTGHGRTLPTGMTVELAFLVVREACGVAQMMLSTHDRRRGAL